MAKKMVSVGKSPAREIAHDKACVKDVETFGAWSEKWLRGYQIISQLGQKYII